jgi:solute carrier family 25 2-oxodicarboxylate transporter 21
MLHTMLIICILMIENVFAISSTTTSTSDTWWKQVIAGMIAGELEVFLTYPLDVIKTKSMLGSNTSLSLIQVIKQQGIIGCYRGVSLPLLSALPWRATKLMSFSQFKLLLTGGHAQNATLIHNMIAGIGVGITESVILTPFEVVKVSIIADQFRLEKLYKGTMDCIQKIYKSEGMIGFMRGYEATCYRQILFSTTYFITYLYCKEYFVPVYVLPALLLDPSTSHNMNHLISGLFAGITGSIMNTPMDVVKTRIQNERLGNTMQSTKIISPIQYIIKIYKTKGLSALYAGVIPKIVRVGPGAAINFVVYEFLMQNVL